MIAFSCAHCGMKFQVQDEFAGRSTCCTTCKQPLTVPAPAAPTTVCPPKACGPAISLAQAGYGGGVTLSVKSSDTDDTSEPFAVKEILGRQANTGERYVVEKEIARGGMGVVVRAVDCDIRREVVLKFLLDQSNPNKTLRFIEEAQITGQLEHPNIVPVHELGIDGHKRFFISMKMVKGRSLAQILDDLRADQAEAKKTYTLGKLLNVLVNICNALAYAHALSVVHRDLKPANVMVGDFGEVYVMDWGLAKIVQAEEKPLDEGDRFAVAMGADPAETNKGSGTGLPRVHTSRAAENELTTEGTVLGTPVYMPPEQATGRLKQIGPRSDVYALGAILYEILTLKPPVDRAGGFQKVLARVVEGNISQPSVRNPERARDGKIPAELAAVAMKALAKDPENRYGSVELLRRDIELFQEGRSVSAKEDTRGEQFLKFVKRNKTFTLAAASAAALVALILLASALINFQAARAAQKAYDDRIAIEREVQQLRRTSVPVLMESARLFLERRRFANALAHLDLALDYDPDHADALLLHGQLLLAEKKDFAGARKDFERYLKHRSEQRDVQDLAKRCGRADADDPTNMLMVAEIFTNQKMPLLADRLLFNYGETPALAKEFLRKIYHDRVEEAWPGMGGRLSLDPGGLFTLNLINGQKVTVLTPIEGMPLSKLYLHACSSVNDLTPLKNMPLTYLDLARTNVTDLSPIEDLPLTYLELRQTRLSDLKPLQKMKLTFLGMHLCPNVVDLSPLAGIPLATLQLSTSPIKDISALKMLPLTDVDLNTCKELQDVGPLKGTKIAKLNLSSCLKLKDLAPLADLPLKKLSLDNCKLITDITMLRGLPLEEISLEGCTGITDLTPLQGLKLTSIRLPPGNPKGIDVLRAMPSLATINNLPATEFWERSDKKRK